MILATPGSISYDAPASQWSSDLVEAAIPGGISFESSDIPSTAWERLNLVPAPPPPQPDVLILGVRPSMFSREGGELLTITLGGAVVPGPIQIMIDGVPCYGGEGFGMFPEVIGGTVVVYSPKLDKIGALLVTAQQGSVESNSYPVAAINAPLRLKFFQIRKSFPEWALVGFRNSSEVDLL